MPTPEQYKKQWAECKKRQKEIADVKSGKVVIDPNLDYYKLTGQDKEIKQRLRGLMTNE